MRHERIMFIMPEYVLGGAEAQQRMLIQALHAKGYRTAVVVLHWFDKTLDYDIEEGNNESKNNRFIELHMAGKSEYELRREVKAALINSDMLGTLDCVIMFHEYTTPLIPFFHDHGIPVIYSERLDAMKATQNTIFKKSLSECDCLTANSKFAADKMRRAFGRDVVVVRNGKSIAPTASIKNKKPIKNILVPCRIAMVKNLDIVLRFLMLPNHRRYYVKFIGEIEDTKYAKELEKWVLDAGLDDRVEFCGYTDKINEAFEWADVMVLPSLAEGTPNVVLEAFGMGCPVIVSDIPPERELVKSEGLRFNPYDAEDLNRAVRFLESLNPEKYTLMLAKHRKHVEEHYSVSKMTEQFSSLIHDVVANKRKEYSITDEEIMVEELLYLDKEYKKKELFYSTLCMWIHQLHDNRSIAQVCADNKWNRIAIYGFQELGRLLLEELMTASVNVECIIDRNAAGMKSVVPVITIEDIGEKNLDVIIVSAVAAYDEIKKMLLKKTDCEIVSLEELVG